MKVLNGFTPQTAQNLQLDAGIIVRGLKDPSTFAGELGEAKSIGATSGGGKFSAVPTMRNLFEDLDGAKGLYKGGQVIDGWDIRLTATIKEMTTENLRMALAAADTTTEGQYDVTKARMTVELEDYLDNICFLGTVNGKNEPMIIELKNVLNVNGLNISTTDKGTGSVELDLVAHFDLSKPEEVPFDIYTPKAKAE